MPTYTDPSTGKKITSQVELSPDELEEAFGVVGGTQQPYSPQSIVDTMSYPQKAAVAVGKGMMDVVQGVKQKGLQLGQAAGLVDPQTVTDFQKGVEDERKLYEPLAKSTKGAGAWEALGQSLPLATIPGGVAGGTAARMATSALGGAVAGALPYTAPNENIGVKAGLGALGGAAGSAVASGVGKVYNAVKQPLSDSASQLARKYNIPTTLGEVTNNPLVKKAETWLETIPVIGLKAFRERQQNATSGAIKNFAADYIRDPNASNVMASNRAYVSSLYDDLKASLPGIGDQVIEPTEIKATATKLLDRYPEIFKIVQDTKTEKLLKAIKGDVADVTTVSPILNAKGNQITTTTPKTLTFDETWELRQGLGDLIGQAKKKLASGDVNMSQLGQLNATWKAVNNDMDNWASSIGRSDISQALKTANDAYKQYVVKYDLVQRALDKSMSKEGDFVSPQKFSTALTRLAQKDKYLNKFTPNEINEITGLANILQVTKRAGQFMENPPTGNRWGIPVMAAEVAGYLAHGTPGGVVAAGGIVGTTGLARFLTGTEAGKRFVLAASKIDPKSPAMKNLVDSAYRLSSRMPAVAASEGAE